MSPSSTYVLVVYLLSTILFHHPQVHGTTTRSSTTPLNSKLVWSAYFEKTRTQKIMSTTSAASAENSLKRTRVLYDVNPQAAFLPSVDPTVAQLAFQRRKRRPQLDSLHKESAPNSMALSLQVSTSANAESSSATMEPITRQQPNSLVAIGGDPATSSVNSDQNKGILTLKTKSKSSTKIPTPAWHAPWKLATVLSSHLGWVQSIAMDPTNDMFATGSADRTIKIWDLAKASVGAPDALKLTLTGHISPVRGLAFSERHPYLFSAGEDKMVKCFDLETNQVIRHYHGHLSGVYCLALHPTLDILITGGRDAVARVWDMRSKTQIHCLTGHDHTVASLLTKSTDPQVITGSHDTTVKLWDLAAGKCMTTLTHHQKSIRALAQPSFENTFVSGAADCLKYWQGKDGRFLKSYNGHQAVVNCLAVNDDGVLVSGGDDGSMHFWDYKTGHNFQSTTSVVQPGSLDAENGIYVAQFDGTGTRLITGEADKTIKIWKQDEGASELTHPIDMVAWRKKCLKEAKQRY